MVKTLKGFISYLKKNQTKVQKAVDVLVPGEIVNSYEPLMEKSRQGPKSIILVTKINSDPKKQIVWKKSVKREGPYEIENNLQRQINIQNHPSYAGILPKSVGFGKSDFFAMEYFPEDSTLNKIKALNKSLLAIENDNHMEPIQKAERKVEIYNSKLRLVREGISLDAKFITKGLKNTQDLPAEERKLELEKDMLANDLNTIIEYKKSLSEDERMKINNILSTIGNKYDNTISHFAKLLANQENSEFRIYNVHGDLGPHHVMGNRMIDIDSYKRDFEIADLARWLKNPLVDIRDHNRVVAEMNYFVLRRLFYEGKIEEKQIYPEVMDVNNALSSPKNNSHSSLEENINLRNASGYPEKNFTKLIYLFYLKNLREDLRVLRHISLSSNKDLIEYLGSDYVIDEASDLKKTLNKWYSDDIHGAFDVLLSGYGRNTLMGNKKETIATIENLRSIVEGTISSMIDSNPSK